MRKKKIRDKSEGNYKKSWEYLKESKNYFLIIFGVFIISVLIGFIFPVFFVEFIQKFIQELVEKTADMNFFQLLIFIFQNNIVTALVGLLLGIIFGIVPLVMCFFNGYVLGFVANKIAASDGFLILLRLLPHGIFEIPALIISLGLGLKLGTSVFSKNPGKNLKYNLENSLRVFLFVILPLLIIAAIIEAGLIFLLG